MNSLSVLRIHYEFSIITANISRIHFPFREFTIDSLHISPIQYLFREYTKNSLSVSRIHFLFCEFHLLRNDYIK